MLSSFRFWCCFSAFLLYFVANISNWSIVYFFYWTMGHCDAKNDIEGAEEHMIQKLTTEHSYVLVYASRHNSVLVRMPKHPESVEDTSSSRIRQWLGHALQCTVCSCTGESHPASQLAIPSGLESFTLRIVSIWDKKTLVTLVLV